MAAGVRLVVLGKQGAGKGTQCVRLSHRYAVPHISTGAQTPLGIEAESLMSTGELLPDELITRMVDERLTERDATTRGFILDGYPRTVVQATMLEEIVAARPLHCVVNLDVPTDLVLQRLVSRRTCVDCGSIYSTSEPPVQRWLCDVCGGEVVQRPDDTAEAIMTRLQAYERETLPLIDFYLERGLLETIDGSRTPDEVLKSTVEVVERRKKEHG